MTGFLLIPICIIAGMLFRKYGNLPKDSHKAINTWLIYIALPSVSLKYLPHIAWSRELLIPVIAPVILWLGGWVYIRAFASKSKLPKAMEGGLKLTAGLSNTSFIGFPLVTAYFGEQYLGIALISDQVTFMLLATAGIIVSMNSSPHHTLNMQAIGKRLLLFPPFLGFVLVGTSWLFGLQVSSLRPGRRCTALLVATCSREWKFVEDGECLTFIGTNQFFV